MLRLAGVVAASCALFAQGTHPDIVRAAKSPYDLARYIDSHTGFAWEPLWKALRIDSVIYIQPCGAMGGRGCSTEILTVQDPDQTILVIQGGFSEEDVYLRYKPAVPGTWRFAGEYSALICATCRWPRW